MLSRLKSLGVIFLAIPPILAHNHDHGHTIQPIPPPDSSSPSQVPDPIPLSTREFWMRRASFVLQELKGSPCPFEAFGAVIVNHTSSEGGEMGKEICVGVNWISEMGNVVLHGEISAMNNCSEILTDPIGQYKLSPREAIAALPQLTLYTTAEPCPMCATAIAYSSFHTLVYGTSITTLASLGWKQLNISSVEVLNEAKRVGVQSGEGTRVLGSVLGEEMDGLFGWQFVEGGCPGGCGRVEGGRCGVVEEGERGGGREEL